MDELRRVCTLGDEADFKVVMIDVAKVKGDDLLTKLHVEFGGDKMIDVIYVEMGNTFNLMHHLRASGAWTLSLNLLPAAHPYLRPHALPAFLAAPSPGADTLVIAAVAQGALYCGSSAGSTVAGRTVQPALWKGWVSSGQLVAVAAVVAVAVS
jgi:peptidase E